MTFREGRYNTYLDVSQRVLRALGDHVHAHGVARRRPELDEEVAPPRDGLDLRLPDGKI